MIRKKLGEITTQQIVILVILIVSFAVILIFLFLLNPGETTEREVCHDSVVMRNVPGASSASSLNCKRDYLCITQDGSCEGMTKPDVVKVKNLDEVYFNLAEQMADCWWMFGEGKVDYSTDTTLPENQCSICDQILLDDSLRNLDGVNDDKISKDALYDYMSKNSVKGKEITYMEYIFGTNEVNKIKQAASQEQNFVGTFGNLQVGKQYFNVMGITSSSGMWIWGGIGAAAGGVVLGAVAFFSGPPGWIAAAMVVGGAVAGGVGGGTVGKEIADSKDPEIAGIQVKGRGIDNQFLAPTILEVESDKFKSLECKNIVTLS